MLWLHFNRFIRKIQEKNITKNIEFEEKQNGILGKNITYSALQSLFVYPEQTKSKVG